VVPAPASHHRWTALSDQRTDLAAKREIRVTEMGDSNLDDRSGPGYWRANLRTFLSPLQSTITATSSPGRFFCRV
jgi:hypothetical protein